MANKIDSYFTKMPVKAASASPRSPPPSPVAEGAVPPKAAPEEPDIEDDFIKYFLQKAQSPLFRGKPTKNRKVAVFGKRYYWGSDVTHPIDSLPVSFRKWCASNKYTGYNSILVNVYTDASDNIGWHMDDTRDLAHGEVVSASFAAHAKDRDKTLASMEFRWPNKSVPGTKTIKNEQLKHGTVVRFNAIKHKKKQCEHRVSKSPCPRVNVTMRRIGGA
jgi:alkylated DNA repair dioxygenase AlkB